MVASTACPAQGAGRRVSLATAAYSKLSGHFFGSREFDLALKMQATAAVADATLLYASEHLPVLSTGHGSPGKNPCT